MDGKRALSNLIRTEVTKNVNDWRFKITLLNLTRMNSLSQNMKATQYRVIVPSVKIST